MNRVAAEPRALALHALMQVLNAGESLDRALGELEPLAPRDRALARALVYGVLREYSTLAALGGLLLKRPLKKGDRDIELLLCMGLFQLQQHRTPDYAVVSDTVRLAGLRGKAWAKGLVNAVLRNFLRQRDDLSARLPDTPAIRYAAPDWIIRHLQADWPDDWEAVLAAGLQPGPMTLRVNLDRVTREDCLAGLAQAGIEATAVAGIPTAVQLARACDVGELPGFDQGQVSVQDAAAQSAVPLLDPRAGDRVLDACAAPGGKTLHLFEHQPGLDEVVALDIDGARLQRIEQNRARCGVPAEKIRLCAADATQPPAWWDGRPFQRVLLDAPCSGSGVIRRHPDIKWLRRDSDIAVLADLQDRLLDALWPTVAPGGDLLYCTCSVFSAENSRRVEQFLERAPAARPAPFPVAIPATVRCPVGEQVLTGSEGRDGFYYALIRKTA